MLFLPVQNRVRPASRDRKSRSARAPSPSRACTSSTVPLKSWNGPSTTLTASPTSNSTLGLGRSAPFFHLLGDFADFGLRHFGRHGRMADEAGDLRRILDHVPGLVVELHVDEDVAGEEFAARDLALRRPCRVPARARPAPARRRSYLPCASSARAPRARPWPSARSRNRYARHTTSNWDGLPPCWRRWRLPLWMLLRLP